ncbi:MAG: hypothetical protein A2023_01105 [Sulfuricurvum sp. GWF2_44_89]|nr:MAG: hypothetical protein A2023_01105 [Sulfuricurvum sp. GWF2_44_89]OHD95190.1 MAG: hypothetical protein A2517_10245 [Sulfuricurvum sp. RIFOXYD12_FULL_44_77]OHD98359.1 MAG: hypothetical protein A2552_11820 [Sulfuricurvum sp. RIFOXYD2_FULL_44_160]
MTETKLISTSQLSKNLSYLQMYKIFDDVLPKILLKFGVQTDVLKISETKANKWLLDCFYEHIKIIMV